MDVSEIQTIEHDVLVIGAGGAGLRAAIESSAQGMSTGVIMKSLLGKAHTVMAEGGMAAALGNVDGRDNWKVHCRDTMRGGKFLNVWRMAELHARHEGHGQRQRVDASLAVDHVVPLERSELRGKLTIGQVVEVVPFGPQSGRYSSKYSPVTLRTWSCSADQM